MLGAVLNVHLAAACKLKLQLQPTLHDHKAKDCYLRGLAQPDAGAVVVFQGPGALRSCLAVHAAHARHALVSGVVCCARRGRQGRRRERTGWKAQSGPGAQARVRNARTAYAHTSLQYTLLAPPSPPVCAARAPAFEQPSAALASLTACACGSLVTAGRARRAGRGEAFGANTALRPRMSPIMPVLPSCTSHAPLLPGMARMHNTHCRLLQLLRCGAPCRRAQN